MEVVNLFFRVSACRKARKLWLFILHPFLVNLRAFATSCLSWLKSISAAIQLIDSIHDHCPVHIAIFLGQERP